MRTAYDMLLECARAQAPRRRPTHADEPGARRAWHIFSWFRSGIDAVNATLTPMRTAVLPSTTEAAIWARVIHPNGALTPAVARAILQLEFGDDDQERMHVFSKKAQEGALTPEEQFEIANVERVGNLLAILKSQSRQLLKPVPRRRS